MLKLLLLSFVAFPMQNFRINNADIDFNNQLNNVLTSVAAIGYLIPKMLKVNEPCKDDEDCPLIMKCCEVGDSNYCCSPNNFIKLKYAYNFQNIQKDS